jgi:uncharacterized protein YbjT (DUF2867 family)
MIVLVTGAAGFVGRSAVGELSARGHRVRAMVRDLAGATALDDIDCELVRGDIADPESLTEAASGCDAVLNLVAILTGKPEDFERVVAGGTANAVAAANAGGASRFVQMSALGTSAATKNLVPYYRSKWEAEQTVAAAAMPHTILRPSFVFGPGGGALGTFLRVARLAPVTPIVGSGTQRIQPIWIDDLTAIIARSVEGAADGVVEVGGPDIVTWDEFWRLLKEELGSTRPSFHVPFWFLRPQAFLLERLPKAPLTRDQLKMLEAGDNVAEPNGAERFDLDLLPLSEQLRRTIEAAA